MSNDHMRKCIDEDDDTYLMLIDVLTCDYVRYHYNLSSLELKSAISVYDLEEHKFMQE